MTSLLGVQLYDGEERCAVVRRGLRALLPQFAFGVAWTLLPSFFFFPLLRMGMFGVGFAAVVTVAGMVYLLRLRLSWQSTAIVATTLRCIDVHRAGFARAVSTAVPWSDVTVVSAPRRSVVAAMLGVGTIRVDMAEKHALSFVLTGVRNPERVQQLLQEVQCLRKGKRV